MQGNTNNSQLNVTVGSILRKNAHASQSSHYLIDQFSTLLIDNPNYNHNGNFSHANHNANVSDAQLHQLQEAKPGNKRAILVDLPQHLYSIPALASFFEPYGEVAMLQILPQKRMWDSDLIDLMGASMCQRLANQSLSAIVEFHSARMAKFIIGILRKRLPTLKFRCALLKPSAAIELTNQADNLGLVDAVRYRTKSKTSSNISDCNSEGGSSSGKGTMVAKEETTPATSTPATSERQNSRSNYSSSADDESGLEEMSSTSQSNRRSSHPATTPSSSVHSFSDSDGDSVASTRQQQAAAAAAAQAAANNATFVSSFKILLNQQVVSNTTNSQNTTSRPATNNQNNRNNRTTNNKKEPKELKLKSWRK